MFGGKLDWRAKVELYEQIRREYEFGAGTIQGVAQKLGVHRRMVREAIQSAVPARRKKTERPHLKMASAALFVEAILESDRKAPRKQRHTARRIYDRCLPPAAAGALHYRRRAGQPTRRSTARAEPEPHRWPAGRVWN
jgi:hypothetical protein